MALVGQGAGVAAVRGLSGDPQPGVRDFSPDALEGVQEPVHSLERRQPARVQDDGAPGVAAITGADEDVEVRPGREPHDGRGRRQADELGLGRGRHGSQGIGPPHREPRRRPHQRALETREADSTLEEDGFLEVTVTLHDQPGLVAEPAGQPDGHRRRASLVRALRDNQVDASPRHQPGRDRGPADGHDEVPEHCRGRRRQQVEAPVLREPPRSPPPGEPDDEHGSQVGQALPLPRARGIQRGRVPDGPQEADAVVSLRPLRWRGPAQDHQCPRSVGGDILDCQRF